MNEASVVFNGMEKGLPLVLAGGEDSLEFFTTRVRGAVARVDFLSAIQMRSRFEAGSLLLGCLPELTPETLHTTCIFILSSTVFSRHEKAFCLGKVRTERKGKGPRRAWDIFPVME